MGEIFYVSLGQLTYYVFPSRSYENLRSLNHGVKEDSERTREFVASLRQPFDRRPFSTRYNYK